MSCLADPKRWSGAAAVGLMALLLLAGTAYAGYANYYSGNLQWLASSGVFANHTEHSVVQTGGPSCMYLQTGHQNTSGAHVAIVRGFCSASWGPSGPAGWYGKPKCWNLGGTVFSVGCHRWTA